MNIKTLYKKIQLQLLKKTSPIKYARKLGVNFVGNAYIYGNVAWSTEPWIITIGDNVYITDGVKFITHDGGTLLFRDRVPDLEITKPIVVGDNVYFGNNVIVLPGVTIGSNVVVGAGAIISRDIPDNSVAAGVPAKVIKTVDEYFEKLQKESLHLGHLKSQEKDEKLREYYGYNKG